MEKLNKGLNAENRYFIPPIAEIYAPWGGVIW